MPSLHSVKITHNFERNLAVVEDFLDAAKASSAFDSLLQELTSTVIPNLTRFPKIGLLFLDLPPHTVEVAHNIDHVRQQLDALAKNSELREYVMAHYLLLCTEIKGTVYLLSIRHQRQLSFDFQALWPSA